MTPRLLHALALVLACTGLACAAAPAPSSAKACVAGKTVVLQARANGLFVTADTRQPATPLLAEASQAQSWEDYTLVDAGGGWVALKAVSDGRYVTTGAAGALQATVAASPSGNEKFLVQATADGYVALKSAANGLYVSANLGQSGAPLAAGWATTIQDWEKFSCAPASTTKHAAVWGAANAWFLYDQQQADRLAILDAMKAAHLRVARIFVREIRYNAWNQIDYVPNLDVVTHADVETTAGYDDTVLARIDQLMLEARQRGIKLILALHDRWYLGDWEGSDIYTTLYGVRAGSPQLHDYYDAQAGVAMMQRLDARLQHVLTHRNPLMGNRAWGTMNDVVFSVEAENEAMGGVAGVDDAFAGAWQCARARAMRPYVSNGVLISTGGTKDAYDSAYPSFFDCADIDVVGIHNYSKGSDVPGQLQGVIALAQSKGKRVMIEEFGCDPAVDGAPAGLSDAQKRQWRATCNEQEILRYEQLGLPWMLWSVVAPSDTLREVFTDDASWPVLSAHASVPPKLGFAWPELK